MSRLAPGFIFCPGPGGAMAPGNFFCLGPAWPRPWRGRGQTGASPGPQKIVKNIKRDGVFSGSSYKTSFCQRFKALAAGFCFFTHVYLKSPCKFF